MELYFKSTAPETVVALRVQKGIVMDKIVEVSKIEKEVVTPITFIETEIWEPVPDKPFLVRKVRDKTIQEVYVETQAFLKENGLYDELDYFLISERQVELFPEWKWIACYAVVGGSEGHYIHVDVIDTSGKRLQIFNGKTFFGMNHALQVSNMLTKAYWNEMKDSDNQVYSRYVKVGGKA